MYITAVYIQNTLLATAADTPVQLWFPSILLYSLRLSSFHSDFLFYYLFPPFRLSITPNLPAFGVGFHYLWRSLFLVLWNKQVQKSTYLVNKLVTLSSLFIFYTQTQYGNAYMNITFHQISF